MTQILSLIAAILFVLFGLGLGLTIIASVIYDIVAYKANWPTVSATVRNKAASSPVWAIIVSVYLGLIVGALIGHLFLTPNLIQ